MPPAVLFLVAATVGLAAGPLWAVPVNTPFVVIGGGPDDPALAAEALSLAGGSQARVAVVAAGSSNPAAAGPAYQKFFGAFGVDARYVPLGDRDAAASAEAVRALGLADLLFFTGGDQRRLAESLAGSPAQGAILDGWLRGAVVAGTSAGAMPWGNVLIANGTSHGALTYAFDRDAQGFPGLELRPGLRMRDEILVDTHFDTRTRLGRLLLALASTPSASALGVDELTAAVLSGDEVRAVGRGAITLLEAPRLLANNAGRASARLPFAAGPFMMHRIRAGQTARLRAAIAPPRPLMPASPSPGFFFGLFGSAAATPPPAESQGPRQPVTLVAAPAPLPTLTSPANFVRDAGGTQARLLILTGNGAARDAQTWRGHLLLLGAGRASVLTASEIHDHNLSQSLERATGVFFLEDTAGSLTDACNANRRRLRDVVATYAPRLPMGAAGLGVRILGDVAYFGHPSDPARQVKRGLELIPDAVAEDQFWESGGLERLVQGILIAERGLGIGLGPENSVRIEHGQMVVIGKGQVTFVEGKGVADSTVPAAGSTVPASAIGLEVSVIPPDGVYDWSAHRPRF